jgi:hypothetical protein
MPAARAAHGTAGRSADRLVRDRVTGAAGRADKDHQKSMAGVGLAAMIADLRDFVDPTRPLVILTSPKTPVTLRRIIAKH